MCPLSGKPEYPALLSPGFHAVSLIELRQLCVEAFQLSKTRPYIITGIETLVARLNRYGVSGELWVNGSFLTRKIDPEDADVVFCCDVSVYVNGTPEQKKTLEWVSSEDLRDVIRCDSYICLEYPENHKLHSTGKRQLEYWRNLYGTIPGGDSKGITVIKCPGGVER